MLNLAYFLQTNPIPTEWTGLEVGGVLAGTVFYFYRMDRRTSEDRYAKLGDDFRQIVQENTAAITALRETLAQGPGNR